MKSSILCLNLLLAIITLSVVKAQQNTPDVVSSLQAISSHPSKTFIPIQDIPIPSGGHLQGVQYTLKNNRPYIYLSGSSGREAYLLEMSIDSMYQLRQYYVLDSMPMKHAGGIQVFPPYLAVGIEDNESRDTSNIHIYHINNFNTPVLTIPRSGPFEKATAGAVAIVNQNDGYLILVANWNSMDIDIYATQCMNLADPECQVLHLRTWSKSTADMSTWIDPNFLSYQNLNLFWDSEDSLMMVGFARNKEIDVADVFLVDLSSEIASQDMLQKIYHKPFYPEKTNFSAGAGMYWNGKQIKVYSCDHHHGVVEVFE